MDADQLSIAVATLRGINAKPHCCSHAPIKSLERGMIKLHCAGCGFTAWLNEQTYGDLLSEMTNK